MCAEISFLLHNIGNFFKKRKPNEKSTGFYSELFAVVTQIKRCSYLRFQKFILMLQQKQLYLLFLLSSYVKI